MGILREKYTREYFVGGVGKTITGEECDYGVLACRDENGKYVLRKKDNDILAGIEFDNANVLEIGFGRGETARYVLEHGAANYVGIDFAEAAVQLAKENLEGVVEKYHLICMDVLEFVQSEDFEKMPSVDVVIFFDVFEHIPRSELEIILCRLKDIVKKNVIVLVNTPSYKYDQDVIKYGYNALNESGTDKSNSIEETAGMHCNQYTFASLAEFMKTCGYQNLTRMHYYVLLDSFIGLFEYTGLISYRQLWNICKNNGFNRLKEYKRDIPEYAYENKESEVHPVSFNEGNMKGITLLLWDEYKKAVFPIGEYDSEMLADFSKVKQKNIVFDVGGFMGISSLLFASHTDENSRIYCFEPNPWNVGRILDNLSLNDNYAKKVQVIPYALGNENSSVEMTLTTNIDNGHSSTSRINAAHATIRDSDLPFGFFKKSVDVFTLDYFVSEYGIIPDVIKVDIEGSEHLFLHGARNTIQQFKPMIYIELHSEFCAVECVAFLYDLGYVIEILHEDSDGRLVIKCIFEEDKEDCKNRNDLLYTFTNISNIAVNVNTILTHMIFRLKSDAEMNNEISNLKREKNNLEISLNEMERLVV